MAEVWAHERGVRAKKVVGLFGTLDHEADAELVAIKFGLDKLRCLQRFDRKGQNRAVA
jgi:hypothetical protein